MAVVNQTLYASHLAAGAVSGSSAALGAPDSTYTTDAVGTSWTARFAIANPTGVPSRSTLVGMQTVTAYVQKAGGTNVSTASVVLYDNGTQVATLVPATSVTGATTLVGTFDGALVSHADNVEIEIVAVGNGSGGPSVRSTIQLDAIKLDAAIEPRVIPWTEDPEVTSATQQAVLQSTGRPVGIYEYEVRTYDGEYWSPWSTSRATFTIPATISAGVATGGSGTAPAPAVGQASVVVPAASASGDVADPLYQAQHVLNTPAASGGAQIVTVEPIWTWLWEQTGVTSSSQSHVLDTDGWQPSQYEWQVRTFDGEYWSPWSTDTAIFTIPSIIAAPTATGSSIARAPSLEPPVTAPAASVSAGAAAPGYQVEHVINSPAAVGGAQDVEPEPIWTWLAEVSSSLQYGDLVTPEGWERGDYEVAVRTFDGEYWSPWSTDTATFFAFPAVRAVPGVGTAYAVVPVIDAGVLIPSAAAGADAVIPDFDVAIQLNAVAAAADASAAAPGYMLEIALFPPAAVAHANGMRPRISPLRTNVYLLDENGVWQEVVRSVRTADGTWAEAPVSQLIGA